MQVERASLVKLAGFGVTAAAIVAAHHSGEAATLAGAGMLLLDSVAHVGFEHLVVDFVHDVARRFDGAETARGVENRDLHRLIGETIARVLEHEAGRAPGGKFGADYLRSAAAEFRGEGWMNANLIGPEIALAEVKVSNFFSGDPEAIKEAPVLEQDEWVKLVERVAGPAAFGQFKILDYAPDELREHFAFELWESVKHAWEKGDLAWPALVLRLLSLTLDHAGDAARNTTGLREEIAALRDAVLRQAQPAIDNAKPGDQILIQAIHGYQGQIMGEIKTLQDLVREALANLRMAPVKERWINLPNTRKQILARDHEAQLLLDAIRAEGPAIISVAAPPGFENRGVLARAADGALTCRSAGDGTERNRSAGRESGCAGDCRALQSLGPRHGLAGSGGEIRVGRRRLRRQQPGKRRAPRLPFLRFPPPGRQDLAGGGERRSGARARGASGQLGRFSGSAEGLVQTRSRSQAAHADP